MTGATPWLPGKTIRMDTHQRKILRGFSRHLPLLLILLPISCSAGYHGGSAAGMQGLTVKDLYRHPEWTGRIVTVCGRYTGWSGCDADTYMITRSDWVLRDDTGCIFVTGGAPARPSPLMGNNTTRPAVCIKARIRWFKGKCTLYFIDRPAEH